MYRIWLDCDVRLFFSAFMGVCLMLVEVNSSGRFEKVWIHSSSSKTLKLIYAAIVVWLDCAV